MHLKFNKNFEQRREEIKIAVTEVQSLRSNLAIEVGYLQSYRQSCPRICLNIVTNDEEDGFTA